MYCDEFLCWLAGFITLRVDDEAALTERQHEIIHAHAMLCDQVEEGRTTVLIREIINKSNEDSVVPICQVQFASLPPLTSPQLSYFLQGHFEISESNEITGDQIMLMKAEFERNTHGFGSKLFEIYNELEQFPPASEKIQEILNSIFLHVIDPSYGFTDETNEELQKVHDAYK